jgi:hypothetical protein
MGSCGYAVAAYSCSAHEQDVYFALGETTIARHEQTIRGAQRLRQANAAMKEAALLDLKDSEAAKGLRKLALVLEATF